MRVQSINNNTASRVREIYAELLRLCSPFLKKKELPALRAAFELMLEHHRPNWEETGKDTVYHAIEVARIVIKDLNLGTTSVICALLHNVIDGNNISTGFIERKFGNEIALITDGYVKLSGLGTEKISIHSENFRKLYLALVKDIRVILVKLAHRLHDMRHFSTLDKNRQKRFLDEVYYLYIPIAHRLGLYNIKTEMEDLWMRHSHPKKYTSIAKKVRESSVKRNAYIRDFIHPIERELMRQGFDVRVTGRPKAIYSIWRKMKKKNVDFEEVYDLFAIRIIINSDKKNEKSDCWRVYSIVTDIYKPDPNRLRDWISTPKASGYESLHTTVIDTNGKWVEVQIRTERMDELAEKGLAAHWKYKEGATGKSHEEWMQRLREVIENPDQENLEKSQLSKIDLYPDKIFVFTPEGDLKNLPAGATVLDFAYDIHTSVGDMCSGARVNRRIVPIRHILNNGDRVEIITSKNQKPKMDWLNCVITAKAKSKIKRALREERYQEAETGKEILKRKLRNRKIAFSDTLVDRLIRHYKLKSSIDLYYLIATDKIDLSNIRQFTTEEGPDEQLSRSRSKSGLSSRERNIQQGQNSDTVVIENGVEDIGFELARCCNPIAGDDVFGFITVGRGIVIHRENCPNAKRLNKRYKYRIIPVKWPKSGEAAKYLTNIHVTGKDRVGMLRDISKVIADDFQVDMDSVQMNKSSKGKFDGNFMVKIKDKSHLEALLNNILELKGVYKAERDVD